VFLKINIAIVNSIVSRSRLYLLTNVGIKLLLLSMSDNIDYHINDL